MNDRTYCCEVEQPDPTLAGSAVQVDVWLLVEYAYAWKPKALEDNILPSSVTAVFDRLNDEFKALGLRLRIQFIKQASSELHCPRLYFADGRDDTWQLLTTQLKGYEEFPHLTAIELLEGRQLGFTPSLEEIYLVCTNGQRDICCARFGRPLYSRLNEVYGDRIWQTTHIGGHRYAPNLLCLPSGFVYGFVSPDLGVNLVQDHGKQKLDVGRLRGRSHYPPHVQAGEIFARQEHNLSRRDDVVCTSSPGSMDRVRVQIAGAESEEITLLKQSVPNLPTDCEVKPKPSSIFSLSPNG